MKFTYPAIISRKEDGHYKAMFPDLATCEAAGDTLEDVLAEAYEAARNWLELELSEEEPDLPPISHAEDLELAPGEMVRNICVNIRLFDGWDE